MFAEAATLRLFECTLTKILAFRAYFRSLDVCTVSIPSSNPVIPGNRFQLAHRRALDSVICRFVPTVYQVSGVDVGRRAAVYVFTDVRAQTRRSPSPREAATQASWKELIRQNHEVDTIACCFDESDTIRAL